MNVYLAERLKKITYAFTLKTVDGRTVFGANSRDRRITVQDRLAGESIILVFEFACAVVPGGCFISLGIALDDSSKDNLAVDRRYDLIHLPVVGDLGDFGVADLNLKLSNV